jgi:ribosomal 50S subunit-recycling heat shock protein
MVAIAGVVATISRALAQRLIDDGQVRLAGQPIRKANHRLRTGDVIDIVVPTQGHAPTDPPAS